MKSTIKLTPSKAVCVQPCKTGGVVLEITNRNALHVLATSMTLHLTEDQCGALLFAIEQAAEALEIRKTEHGTYWEVKDGAEAHTVAA